MRFVIFCLLLISTLFAATTTIPKYNRDDYGKTWGIVNPKTHIDTRDSILIRDNTAPVGTYIINTKTHKIDIGSWVCPYCGKVFIDPLKLDIDHVVERIYIVWLFIQYGL